MIQEHEMVPYRRLICSIIIQAVVDYQDVLKKDGIAKAEASKVGRWFLSPCSKNEANFVRLCDMLNLQSERLLSRLNTRDLVKEMRAYQKALEDQYKRYQAMVAGASVEAV